MTRIVATVAISRGTSPYSGRLRGHQLWFTFVPRAKRGAGLLGAPPRAAGGRSPISPTSDIDDGLRERSHAVDAQTIDLIDRGRSGTAWNCFLENRYRFAVQAAPIGRSTSRGFGTHHRCLRVRSSTSGWKRSFVFMLRSSELAISLGFECGRESPALPCFAICASMRCRKARAES